MNRRRPDALLLIACLVGGYLAVSPTLRGEPVQPATGTALGSGLSVGEPDRVLRGAPAAPDGRNVPDTLSGSDSQWAGAAYGVGAGSDPAGAPLPPPSTAGTSGPTPRPVEGQADPSPVRSAAARTPPPTLPPTDPPRKPQTPRKAPQRTQTPLRASTRPQTASGGSGRLLTGRMSWYCLVGRSACTVNVSTDCACAAAGPALRRALGDWRGRVVTVTVNGASARTRLIDFCQCPDGRILDGYAALWGGLGLRLSDGIAVVEVRW